MKEFIDKLSRGVIEYERPIIEVSVSEIDFELDTNEKKKGSFTIKSINNIPVKCVIYSSNQCLKPENNTVVGLEGKIEYTVDGSFIQENTEITGNINIVSNGGEYTIPYRIGAQSRSAGTVRGKIRNMFHFANYVQTDYEDALKLFQSEDFKKIFLGGDLKLISIYDGLIESNNKRAAMEEFLIAANKKKRVTLSLSEDYREYDHPTEIVSESVIISKDSWGYVDIRIESDCHFIQIQKKHLTSDDFAGSNYEYTFLLRPDKLHGGINYGTINFIDNNTSQGTLSLKIKADNKKNRHEETMQYKKYIAGIYRFYLDFRMHKCDMQEWSSNTLEIINKIRSINDEDYFIKLLQAQIYISRNMESDASWLLENVAETLIEKRNILVNEYSYYLYVRTLQKRDRDFTEEMKKKIREIYDNGHENWEILWVLLYMDDIYDNNVSLKLARIKEQYSMGMRSPIMYFEAAMVFLEQPSMLRMLNDFEKQVIFFILKNGIMTEKLALEYACLALKERTGDNVIMETIKRLYKIYNNSEILAVAVSLLIRDGLIGERFLPWYREGIEKELKIAGIYEYYLNSLPDDYDKKMPPVVYMYFNYNTDVANDKLSLLYAGIIKHREEIPDIYNAYMKQIEKHAASYMINGKVNKNLAVIYKDVMSKSLISPEIAEVLPDILCTCMIKCRNTSIKSVIVVHKELKSSENVPVTGGVAYVRIYTEEPVIIFEDIYGNRYYKDIEYTMEKLFDMEDYLKMCYEISAQNIGLSMHFADEYIRYRKNSMKSIGILQLLIKMKEIRPEYKAVMENEIIDYYMDNYDGDSLDEYLESVETDYMDINMRNKIIELLIIRNHYNKAMDIIRKYGYMNIEPRRIMMLASRIISLTDYEENSLVTELSAFAFLKGKYDEIILEYLSRYYYGTTKEMLHIWDAGNDFSFQSRELEERLLGQMLFTGIYLGSIGKVYDSYFKKGPMDKIKKAYLISKSYDYFVKEKIVDEKIFDYINRELDDDEDIADICKFAYIKYYREIQGISGKIKENAKNIIEYFCAKNIIFEFFKEYKKYFSIPYVAEDKTILEYRTNPDSKVYINYIIETGTFEQKNYTKLEMRSVYPGIFTFDIILFYGERLIYYISEEHNKESIITESRKVGLSDRIIGENPSRYGILNDIMICKELHEESTLAEIARGYDLKQRLTDEMFKIM